MNNVNYLLTMSLFYYVLRFIVIVLYLLFYDIYIYINLQ